MAAKVIILVCPDTDQGYRLASLGGRAHDVLHDCVRDFLDPQYGYKLATLTA